MNLSIEKKYKIAIFGTGRSALRFIESYIFLNAEITLITREQSAENINISQRFNVNLISLNRLSSENHFDVMIFSIPLECKSEFIANLIYQKKISEFLVIEKPFAKNLHDALMLHLLLRGNEIHYVVPYTRFFDPKYVKYDQFKAMENVNIKVYNHNSIDLNDGLPHFINFLINSLPEVISVDKSYFLEAKLKSFSLHTYHSTINVYIEETWGKDVCMEINGVEFPYPNFRIANMRMLEYLLNTKVDKEVFYINNLRTVDITKRILSIN